MRTLAAVLGFTTWLLAGQAAPPGQADGSRAEGFGAQTPGGHGGRRIAVTSLADRGPGTFREAVGGKGPRVVVFETAGLVTLDSPVVVQEPYITIDGASAPGEGICIRGRELAIRTHDVIVRHMRFRPGDLAGVETDALTIGGDSHHVLVDHVSASWATDETLSASGAIHDVTIQWSIIAEGLNRSVHSKGAHGYGSLVRAVGGVTLHHNLWVHNDSRNPRLGDNYGAGGRPTFDVRNNVIYNYGNVAHGMVGDRLAANFIGNYIRPGPSSNRRRGPIVLTDTAAVEYFVRDNVVDGRDELTADNAQLFDRMDSGGRRLLTLAAKAFTTPPVATTSAAQALRAVLAGAGATLPRRDAVDARVVRDVEAGSGRIIDSQKDVGGWPAYRDRAPASEPRGRSGAWSPARGRARASGRPKPPGDYPPPSAGAGRRDQYQ